MSTSPAETPDPARSRVPLLQRREIEAQIVGPLLRAFSSELGRERTLAIVRGVITDVARQNGEELARQLGSATLETFAGCLDLWKEGEALEITVLRQTPEHLDFNVTRCRYAEMYHALGLGDLGFSLSCRRDFALIQGFNPSVTLERTQTIMEGAEFCDFRFRVTPGAPPIRTAPESGLKSGSDSDDHDGSQGREEHASRPETG